MYCISGWGFCSSLPLLSIPHASFHSATRLHLSATIAPHKHCSSNLPPRIFLPRIFSQLSACLESCLTLCPTFLFAARQRRLAQS
jgi:hypothetical protein